MKIKDKHCICKKWEEEYLEAIRSSFSGENSEVIKAQERGIRCPFCDKKLIEKERKAFVRVQFPPVFVDKPNCDVPSYYREYYVSMEEFKRMLEKEK